MKVCYDNIIYSLQSYGGISVYWNELSKRIKLKSDIELKVIELSKDFNKSKERVFFEERVVGYDRNVPLIFSKYLPILNRMVEDNSILHSSYYRFSLNNSIKNITTIHDFTYELHIGGLSAKVHQLQKRLAIKNSSGIICVSESTKKDLVSAYPDIDNKIVKVIRLAASDCYFPITNIDILETRFSNLKDNKILSFVGKRIKYKNFSLAISILKNLPEDYHLVIVGGGDLNTEEIEMLSCIKEQVTYFKNLTSEEINILYNISFCYLYPSEYEGFGIPILEAMQAGCPVLCQNVSSIPEVYGQVDNLVMNINCLNECCENIIKLEDATYRKKVIMQGWLNAKNFSWDKTFNQTFEFYNYINDLE